MKLPLWENKHAGAHFDCKTRTGAILWISDELHTSSCQLEIPHCTLDPEQFKVALIHHSCLRPSTYRLGHVIMTPGWDCWDPMFISSEWVTEIPSSGKECPWIMQHNVLSCFVFHKCLQTSGIWDTSTETESLKFTKSLSQVCKNAICSIFCKTLY